MGLGAWIALFAITSLFWAWILFWGGADWLEGSWLAAVFLYFRAMEWSAEGIKAFAALMWLAEGLWFTLGLFVRDARMLWL